MAKVGDAVEIAGRKIGESAREGTVVGVTGAMLRIRWSSGEESSLIPGPGTMTVVGSRPSAAKKAAAPAKKKTTPAKKSPAAKKKAPAKKSPVKKKAPAKKSAAKKSVKKAPAKKSGAKKATKKRSRR